MPQGLLGEAQVLGLAQEIGGEGVAQQVGMDIFVNPTFRASARYEEKGSHKESSKGDTVKSSLNSGHIIQYQAML